VAIEHTIVACSVQEPVSELGDATLDQPRGRVASQAADDQQVHGAGRVDVSIDDIAEQPQQVSAGNAARAAAESTRAR
jgi:hypothetical protein